MRRFDREDDVVLVKHLVVLEIVQQRRWNEVRVAGKEDRGALDDMGRTLLKALDQIWQRYFDAPGLRGQDRRTAAPGPYHDGHCKSEQQRHPCAFQQLEEIGAEEGHVDD